MLNQYWTEVELARLETAEDFHLLAEVAITILARMREVDEEIIQVCGPISSGGLGDPELNKLRLEAAIRMAGEQGYHVFNQMPFETAIVRIMQKYPPGQYCTEVLEVFYRTIFESGYIRRCFFVPNWHTSFGAKWERRACVRLGILLKDIPDSWFETADA
ncbi:MAG: hypothetical protein JWL80_217 [Parcubacteria group bacterium]|nr:hypothetical protein [Parcubacteria group bacterium]